MLKKYILHTNYKLSSNITNNSMHLNMFFIKGQIRNTFILMHEFQVSATRKRT